MTDANEASETALAELNEPSFAADADENTGEQETSSSAEHAATDDIPPSLISYFETSKSRAVVCESLILEDFEDFPTSYEDMKNPPIEFHGDVMKLNEQINNETEEEDTSTDSHLLCEPTETDVLLPHNVNKVCSHNEDKGETEVHMESARHLAFKVVIPKTPVKEGDIKESRRHREKQHLEEMTKEKQRVQRENDFQEELKKIIEAEKLHQMELQLMGKRAQERLEDELLLQKELISNFQKRVMEERRMREEELKRINEEEEKKRKKEERRRREEEDRRKRHDEKMKRDMQSIEKEMKRRKEEVEKRRIEEARHKAEEERRNNEELAKKKEECKRGVENDGKWNKEEQKTKAEEGRGKEGEERKLDGSEEEEKRKQMEEGGRKAEKEEIKEKEKDKKEEDVESQKREEEKETREVLGKRMEGDKSRKDEETILKEQWRKEEGKTRYEEEISLRNELEVRIHKQREEHRKTEEEIRKGVMEMIMGEDMRKEKENRKIEDEMQLEVNTEKQQIDVEWRYSMENNRIRQENEKIKEDKKEKETIKIEEESKIIKVQDTEKDERLMRAIGLQQVKRKNGFISEGERTNSTAHLLTSQLEDSTTWLSSSSGPSHHTVTAKTTGCETVQQHIADSYVSEPMDQPHAAGRPRSYADSLPGSLPERTEHKRLSWMKDCIPWSKLSRQNRRKRKGSGRSGRLPRRPAETSSLPALCSETLLRAAGLKSLQEVTTVTLEDLPGCNLSTLLQCSQLRSLTLRRCGLKSLQGISQLPELCYIDVEENDISFVDCENMTSLRVLRLGHNKLTSIHGLSGADNLDVLELSHNSISRIAGLESLRRLQRLSVDHNQLISTKGLRDIYTLLHLNCSYNHLASVEGLENSPLLNTLDLRANGLTESPSLTNHVLLRELHLDDNSISSLQSLTACWLPLMQHLSVAQNGITQLPPMSDFISLENLDLRFNCMSELQNVCESLEGCQFLQNIHLTGNPLQQESGWRSSLQKALLGLRAIDDQETDYFLSPPAVQQSDSASVSFLSFCQTQIQQINDLQQRHGRELSEASSPLDAIKSCCQHFSETLKLAEDQRFAHEYGDINTTAGQTVVEKTVDVESTNAETFTEHLPLSESTVKAPPVFEGRNCIRGNCCIFDEKSSTESREQTLDTVRTVPSANLQSSATKGKTFSSNCKMPASCNHQDPALQNTAAGVIQQRWRKYRQKCGSICGPPVTEKQRGRGGDGGPQSRPFYINGKSVDPHNAATAIQAFWRGCVVRRRLLSALAAVTSSSTGEDDTFEEMDVDKFVFDEAALEKLWTLQICDDSPSRPDPVSEEPLSLKVPGPFPDHFQYTLPPQTLLEPKQAWVGRKQVDPAGLRVSPESSCRKSPASTPVLSGIPERLEKILEEWGFTDSHTALLMLKRAQKMKSKQQQKNKCMDPSVRLALFRNCHYQLGLVEARSRPASHSRKVTKVCKTTLGLKQCERKEQLEQWLQSQSDGDSVSEHFLPELSPDILKGGRVQLVADPAYTERHHASGLWDNSGSAAHPRKRNNHAHRISSGHARKEVPSPQRVTSAPSKKERISFRDNPVQLSGGWGGGKKRDKVYK